jgi:hypothetical protein
VSEARLLALIKERFLLAQYTAIAEQHERDKARYEAMIAAGLITREQVYGDRSLIGQNGE